MIRVLLVCGSLQAKSSNRAALDVAAAHLVRRGDVAIEHADELGAIPALNVDHQDRPGSAVESFRARLGRADAVLIACPEYAGALAGALKNALDWIVAGPRAKSDADGAITDPDTIGALERLADELVGVVALSADERLERVEAVTAAVGVEPGHIAPLPVERLQRASSESGR